MRTRLKLKPGQRGTKKVLEEYGEQLVCVRYRYDAERQKRLKTVEIIVEEVPWHPAAKGLGGEQKVGLRVAWGEVEISQRIKKAGGRWNREKRVWEISYKEAVALGLEERIMTTKVSTGRGKKASTGR